MMGLAPGSTSTDRTHGGLCDEEHVDDVDRIIVVDVAEVTGLHEDDILHRREQ
jgi:hypothetical protein